MRIKEIKYLPLSMAHSECAVILLKLILILENNLFLRCKYFLV